MHLQESSELESTNTENGKNEGNLYINKSIIDNEDLEKTIDSLSSFEDFETIGTLTTSCEAGAASLSKYKDTDSPLKSVKSKPFWKLFR